MRKEPGDLAPLSLLARTCPRRVRPLPSVLSVPLQALLLSSGPPIMRGLLTSTTLALCCEREPAHAHAPDLTACLQDMATVDKGPALASAA
ncbi:hypothetical protein CC80DRAFT_115675 [Byssothecium circinans]|uniref:Uncharacterized protein n=1 Tax=Byssothecium circinans TaxID=147558 RepID=A0A6A5TSY2_9PLEO|nr:hypothetical protein CC80DRAFT_115675 [Byssothecium circinans]